MPIDVRFGSEADTCAAKSDVRFTPDSDRESGFSRTAICLLYPQKQTCAVQSEMSAKGQKRTSLLIEQLIGTANYCAGDFETQCLCGGEIDEQFKGGRLYDWQAGWFLAFQDPGNMVTSLPKSFRLIGTVADQQAGSDTIARF